MCVPDCLVELNHRVRVALLERLVLTVVIHGSRISASIPWSKIGSEPVSLTLEGVYLVAGPLDESDFDEGAQREWSWARKQHRLDAHLPGVLQKLEGGDPMQERVSMRCARGVSTVLH